MGSGSATKEQTCGADSALAFKLQSDQHFVGYPGGPILLSFSVLARRLMAALVGTQTCAILVAHHAHGPTHSPIDLSPGKVLMDNRRWRTFPKPRCFRRRIRTRARSHREVPQEEQFSSEGETVEDLLRRKGGGTIANPKCPQKGGLVCVPASEGVYI